MTSWFYWATEISSVYLRPHTEIKPDKLLFYKTHGHKGASVLCDSAKYLLRLV